MKTEYNRREFLARLGAGAAGIALIGNFGYILAAEAASQQSFKAIRIDFSKCAGCRTCEMACSASNHPVEIENEKMDGLGNPSLSNIKVWHYNPDVDVPVTCYLCPDAPCIEACPVEPDPITGHRAIYRDQELGVILCEHERCIGCAACALTCELKRGAVIIPDERTKAPTRMCTLCQGDPACVNHCPYSAITLETVNMNALYAGDSPDRIAEQLTAEWYPEWKQEVK